MGGDGGFDTLAFLGTPSGSTMSQPTDPHSGVLVKDGISYAYSGLEPVLDDQNGGNDSYEFLGTGGADDATLSAIGTTFSLSGGTFETTLFTVDGATDLVFLNFGQEDTVRLLGQIDLANANLVVTAGTVIVEASADVSTEGEHQPHGRGVLRRQPRARRADRGGVDPRDADGLAAGSRQRRRAEVRLRAVASADIDLMLGEGLLADTLMQDGVTLGGFTGIDVEASATVSVGAEAVITADALLIEAASDVQVDASVTEVQGLLFNDTSITNTTRIDVAHGARLAVGAAAVTGEAGESVVIRAVDTPAVNYAIDNAVGPIGTIPSLLDPMLSLVGLERTTEVELGQEGAAARDADFLDAGGAVSISAANAGAVANRILPATHDTNPTTGSRSKEVTLFDGDTVVLAEGYARGGTALGVYAWGGGDGVTRDLYREDYSTGDWTYLGQKSLVDFFGIAGTTLAETASVDIDQVGISGASVGADASNAAIAERSPSSATSR